MQVVSQEQAAAAAAATHRREAHKERQVTKVLEASKMRSQRAARVAKLKVGFSRVRSGRCLVLGFGLLQTSSLASNHMICQTCQS